MFVGFMGHFWVDMDDNDNDDDDDDSRRRFVLDTEG